MNKKYNFFGKAGIFSLLVSVMEKKCLRNLVFEEGFSEQLSAKKNHYSLVLGVLLTVFTSVAGMAQVTTNSGSGLNPTYPNLATAITALNGATITGPVVITLTGNETAPAGGYVVTAEGTAVNTITIEGVGSTITASGALIAGALNDAIFRLEGADFVKLQGFTMLENAANTTTDAATNTMTEWGVAILYASAINGCQSITIQNNTIDLNRTYQNSFGIYSNSTHAATTPTTLATATGVLGGNHNLKIYGNTITDVNMGVVVVGPTTASDFNDGLDVGGAGLPTGNTITNFGTTGTFSAFPNVATAQVSGIYVKNVVNIGVTYNTITSSDGGTTVGSLRGVYIPVFSAIPTGTITNSVSNNSMSLRNGAVSGFVIGISLEGSTATTSATLNINNNDFNNFGHTLTPASTVPTGAITIINNGATALNTNINGNTFTNLSVGTSASFTFIFNSVTRPVNAVCNVNDNRIVGGFTKTNAGGSLTFYNSSSSTPNSGVEINTNNNFSNVTVTGSTIIAGWVSKDGATVSPYGASKTVTGNVFNNIMAGTGAVTILSVANSNSATVNSVFNNTISNITGTTGNFTGIDLANGKQSVTGNTITAVTATTATFVKGINIANGVQSVSDNTVSGITATTGAIKGIVIAAGTNNIFRNTLNNLKTTGVGSIAAMEIVGTQNIYNNKIYDIEVAGTGTVAGNTVTGIAVTGNSTLNIYNNLIGDLRGSGLNYINAVVGMNVPGTTTANLYNNTVALDASVLPSVTNFGTSAVSFGGSVTVTLKNNILVNTSASKGTGKSPVFRKGGTITNYTAGSNNNLFYGSVVFFDGTNFDTSLADFQTRVTPRDNASISELPSFVSMLGANAGFLHINPSVPTQINAGGIVVATVTDDFDGDVRDAATPDIGADEFTPILCSGAVGGTTTPAAATLCVSGSTIISAAGYTVANGILYQWQSSSDAAFTTPVNEGTATVIYANLTTPVITATTYYRLVVICSAGTPNYSAVSTVTITTSPAPTGLSPQTFTQGQTLANIAVTGDNIVWYASASDAANAINPLPVSTLLVNNTTYYATQSVSGCASTTSLAVLVTVTMGTDDFTLSNLKVYPNPVSDILRIENPQSITTVEVFNIAGQKIMSKAVNAMTMNIPMSEFAAGTYFVKVTAEDAVKTIKVIKKL